MDTVKKQNNWTNNLHDIAHELDKCARCGQCRSVCPIFDSLGWEKYSARGKIELTRAVLHGELDLTASYEEVINNCLLCLACVENCGSGVRMDHIIVAARNELVQKKGLPVFKRIAHRVLLSGRELMDVISMGGSVVQYLLFKRVPESSGLKRRFPLPMVEKDRYIPALVHRPFRSKMPEINPVQNAGQKVVFFTGCLINYVYPQIGESVVSLLNHFNTDVIIPRHQGCCGAPAEVGGDFQTTKALARNNIDILFSYPHDIITACASGGYMLKKVYQDLFDPEDPYYQKILSVAGRTYDISEYLVKKIGMAEVQRNLKQKSLKRVTYHDPCHLVRGQGIVHEPRKLLQAVFGDGYVEMSDADRCCGSGGTYGLTHRNTSLNILNGKTGYIMASGAKMVATGCPGCMIQLRDGLQKQGCGVEVFHVAELIFQHLI